MSNNCWLSKAKQKMYCQSSKNLKVYRSGSSKDLLTKIAAALKYFYSKYNDQTDYFASDVYEDLRGQLPKFKAKARDYNLPKQSKF